MPFGLKVTVQGWCLMDSHDTEMTQMVDDLHVAHVASWSFLRKGLDNAGITGLDFRCRLFPRVGT